MEKGNPDSRNTSLRKATKSNLHATMNLENNLGNVNVLEVTEILKAVSS